MAYSTNVNVYYVDYAAGNDATGDGSSGTPWKTLQYAVDNLTPGTDGSIVLLDTGADHVLATSFSVATLSPTLDAPLMIAGNGGQATIDFNAGNSLVTSQDNVVFCRVTGTNLSFLSIVYLGSHSGIVDCVFDMGVKPVLLATPVVLNGARCFIIRSSLKINSVNNTSFIDAGDDSPVVMDSHFVSGSAVTSILYGNTFGEFALARGNYFIYQATPGAACNLLSRGSCLQHNVYYCTTTGWNAIFRVGVSPNNGLVVTNNYVEGFTVASVGLSSSSSFELITAAIKENYYVGINSLAAGLVDDIDSLQYADNTIEASQSAIAGTGSATDFSNRLAFFAPVETDVYYTTRFDSIGAVAPNLAGSGAETVAMSVA
jgi:hypothetical protein